MLFSLNEMVVTTTGFCFSTQQRSAFASLLTARTPAGSMAAVLAPLFVAHSRLARAQSKRRSGLNPAVRRDGDRDFDPQRAKGARAGLSKRDLPARGRRASSRALHAGRSLSCLYCLSRNTTSGLVSTHPGRRPGAVPKALARGPSPIWRRGNESGLQGFPGHPPPGTGPQFPAKSPNRGVSRSICV